MSTASVLINHPGDGELGRQGMTLAAAELPLKSLPLGFRFHPTDEELINHYLKGKIDGSIRSEMEVIIEVDVCKCEPWDIPGKSLIQSDDQEWFFFAPRDRKYPNGHRTNRATEAGYWKATGKDRKIRTHARPHAGPTVIGTKKTLVFHRGRAPRGVRTNWIMHEYRTAEPEYESGEQGSYVLYRLFKKLESPSSNFDAMEKSGFSPTPSRSSPGDAQTEPDILEEFATPSGFSPALSRSSPCDAQNEPDTSEEFTTPLHRQSTGLDLQEDPQSLSDTIKKRPAHIDRWLADKSDCSTTYSVKPEESHCNGNMTSDASDHEAKVAVDALLGVLAESYDPQYDQIDSDGFPTISSPMLPYVDRPLFGNIDQGSHMGLYLNDKSENDTLNELLSMIISNQEEYSSGSSYAQKDSVVEMVPLGNVSMPHNSFWDSAPGKDSAWASDVYTEAGVLQGGSSRQASDWLSFDRCPEIKPNFGNQYENASLLPYESAGPDVYSVDPTSESLQELFDSMEGSASQNNTINAEHGLNGTGINIRSRKPQNPPTSNNILASQGKATRRIRLQVGPISCESTGSTNGKDDHEGKAMTSECLQEREHVEHKSVGGEILGPAQLDRLKNLSINDFMASPKTTPDSSEMFEETKPTLRPRAKWNSDAGLEPKIPPLLQRTPRAVSAAVSITRLVILVMILVLLSVGIRCMRSQCVDSSWFFII